MADPDHLRTAVSKLEAAAEAVEDGQTADRLADFADQLERLAADGRTADHGRLARILHVLSDVQDDAGEDAHTAIDQARAALRTYREGVEGV